METTKTRRVRFACAAAAGLLCFAARVSSGYDGALAPDVVARMDSFQRFSFDKAEKAFAAGQYDQASTLYGAFFREFQKSPAAPYALFRRARAIHRSGDTRTCIPLYEEVLDFYPTLVEYATPALHFTAECHVKNRDLPKAIKVWNEIATDEDYRRHTIAAHSIASLAAAFVAQGKVPEGIQLYRQVAVDFRTLNPDPAREARNKVLEYFVRISPNEPELRRFYAEVGGFDDRPCTVNAQTDLATDRGYWQSVWRRVWAENAYFNEFQKPEKKAFLECWAAVLRDRFPDWKEYQDQVTKITATAAATNN